MTSIRLRRGSISRARFIGFILLLTIAGNLAFVAVLSWHFARIKKLEILGSQVQLLLETQMKAIQLGHYREVVEALLSIGVTGDLGIKQIVVFSEINGEIITSTGTSSTMICKDQRGWMRDRGYEMIFCAATSSGVTFQIHFIKSRVALPFDREYLAASIMFSTLMSLILGPVSVWYTRRFTEELLSFTSDSIEAGVLPQRLPSDLSKMIGPITRFFNKIESLNREIEKRERLSALGEISRQVAHDIRSPVGVLNLLAKKESLESDEIRLIGKVSQRVERIAEELLLKYRNSPTALSAYEVDTSTPQEFFSGVDLILQLDNLIVEKRVVTEPKVILYLLHNLTQFEGDLNFRGNLNDVVRIVSNLIDNGYEALAQGGKIIVEAIVSATEVCIIVRDNGPGLDPDLLETVGSSILSSRKSGGNGMGIYYASRKVVEWGGALKVFSPPGSGCSVHITLPVREQEMSANP